MNRIFPQQNQMKRIREEMKVKDALLAKQVFPQEIKILIEYSPAKRNQTIEIVTERVVFRIYITVSHDVRYRQTTA